MIRKNQKCLFILLNWNGTADTLACVNSLMSENDQYDVLIIDNASGYEQYQALVNGMSDALSADVVEATRVSTALIDEYKIGEVTSFYYNETGFTVLQSKVNHGFSRGCNLGARISHDNNYRDILFLNNDTTVKPGFYAKMRDSLENCDGVIPQIRYFHNNELIWNCGGFITKYGKRKYLYSNEKADDVIICSDDFKVTFVTGCCLLFRTEYFISIGLFSEAFFFGEEDIDLSLRLKKSNARLMCNPEAIIYHKVGASLTGDSTRLLRKAYIHYLNRFVNMKNHLGGLWYLWLLPSSLKVMINVIRKNKLSLFASINFTAKIVKDAFTLTEVNKSKFEHVLKDGY